jgi:hypothetical protein
MLYIGIPIYLPLRDLRINGDEICISHSGDFGPPNWVHGVNLEIFFSFNLVFNRNA